MQKLSNLLTTRRVRDRRDGGTPAAVVVESRWEFPETNHDTEIVRSGPLEFTGRKLVEEYVDHDAAEKTHVVDTALRSVDISTSGRSVAVDPPPWIAPVVDLLHRSLRLRLFEVDTLTGESSHRVIDVNPVVSLEGVADGVDLHETLLRSAAFDAVRRRR